MPAHPSIVRPTRLEISVPEDLRLKMDLFLFSDLEGRVPKGAYSRFIIGRLQEFFNKPEVKKEESSNGNA